MKKVVLAVVFSLGATAAFAGGVAEPAMQVEEVVAKASSFNSGLIVPLLLLLALAIAASNKATPAPV